MPTYEGSNRFISEPEPRRYQINEGMFVLVFVDVLQEIVVHHVHINAFKRDDEMRREPAFGFDGNHWRELTLDIFENRKRSHALKGVQLVPNNDSLPPAVGGGKDRATQRPRGAADRP